MIQTFIITFNSFLKNKKRNLFILSALYIFLYSIIYYKFHLTDKEDLTNLNNNILQFSSIFSAILITFIVSKIFQIRNERNEKLKTIIALSNKVTDLRRICRILIDNHNFWDVNTKRALDNKYKRLTYFHIYDDYLIDKPTALLDDFNNEKTFRGSIFYLALRSFMNGSKDIFQLELFSKYDYDIIYPFKIISNWLGVGAANSFYYYLDHKWPSYKHAFNFNAIPTDEEQEILHLAKKINGEKYQNSKFNKDLLVEIGNDFENEIFPRLNTLSHDYESDIPETLKFLINLLSITILFGVLIPLLISSININILGFVIIEGFSLAILTLSFIYFITDFKKVLIQEIRIK